MKSRADVILVNNGLFPSRERAQIAIMEGSVFAGNKKILKASEQLDDNIPISVHVNSVPYVSRGALKLIKAVDVFNVDFHNKIIMDIGASTGGFTEVCLINGAKLVYAIDVGYGQLDWKLRNDPRVIVMERTNARYLKAEQFDIIPSVTVMDVSFISIRLLIPVAVQIMGNKGLFITLIKPQFEAGRNKVGKKGVVRDPSTHCEVINSISEHVKRFGWIIDALDYSPITGPEGNIEFLARITPIEDIGIDKSIDNRTVKDIVTKAHNDLS